MARPRSSRSALLVAAERIFAERGLAGARTEEIASAARINNAMLHYYFETKEKLYQAVLENLFQQLLLSLRDPLSRTPAPRAALLGFVDRYINFLQQHPNYPRLLQREIMERGPYLRVVVERYLGPIFSSLARILRAGIRRGEFRSVDVNQTVVSLIAITVFYFAATPVMSLVLGGNAYDARRVAARKRAVVDFVRHGLLRSPHQKPSAATNRKRAKKKGKRR